MSCLRVCLSTEYMPDIQRTEEGIKSPGAGVIHSYEPVYSSWSFGRVTRADTLSYLSILMTILICVWYTYMMKTRGQLLGQFSLLSYECWRLKSAIKFCIMFRLALIPGHLDSSLSTISQNCGLQACATISIFIPGLYSTKISQVIGKKDLPGLTINNS